MSTADYEQVSDPGHFIAAIPHLLGFHPTDSLVLVVTNDETGVVATALRTDLPPAVDEAEFVEHLVEEVHRAPANTVHLVAVATATTERRPAEPPFKPLLLQLVRRLREDDITVGSVNWASTITAGAPWRTYETAEHGVVPDPNSTVFTAKCTYAGLITHASREDMARTVAPHASPEILHVRAKRLDRLLRDNVEPNPHSIYDAITRAQRNQLHLDDDQIIQMGWALTFHSIRDNFVRLCIDRRARAAQHVWLTLMRELPAPWRAEPAALFAICAYAQGDGPLAGAALDSALESNPSRNLSALTNGFLRNGMAPDEFRGVLERLQEPPGY
ncbi:uncharacterized protein DUF4192 [Saccharothrix variisporea]|uniref:Uncharacterized protein DUF4192 n=1 Tax=Saccharothrix variisporea TaxID=543527 RepID=A0A495X9I2_9PSEU|nr:uncharacterized protein DUF4192 [Saccharothrix variisporea]